jgi:hypothetical protein
MIVADSNPDDVLELRIHVRRAQVHLTAWTTGDPSRAAEWRSRTPAHRAWSLRHDLGHGRNMTAFIW